MTTQYDPATGHNYAIISMRGDRDLKNFTDWQNIIEHDGNVFAIVKQRPIP